MNYLKKPQTTNHTEDEIDLKVLFLTLWQGKGLICLITIIGTVIALAYVLLAQSWWTSKAIVTLPTNAQLYNYNKLANNYSLIISNYNVTHYQAWSNDSIFQNFITEFNSFNNKKQFLESSTELNVIKQELNLQFDSTLSKLKFYNDWSNRLQAALLDPKDPKKGFQLSVQATTQENSLILLTNYIDYINKKTNQNILQDLQSAVNLQISSLQTKESILKPQIKETFSRDLFKIDEAYKIAKMAGIEKPIDESNDPNDIFAINSGSVALKAKSDIMHLIEKNIDDNLNLLSPEWSTLNSQLAFLVSKKEVFFPEVSAYQYLASPEMPISRDKPKRALIVIIGFVISGLIGCGFVLVRSAFRNDKNDNNINQ